MSMDVVLWICQGLLALVFTYDLVYMLTLYYLRLRWVGW